MLVKSFKIAIGALLAGATLTACGTVRTGAAALIGGDRITIARLDTAVTQWSEELPKHPAAQQIVQQSQMRGEGPNRIPFDPSSPQRSALYQLVDMRIWSEVARGDGVGVTTGQIDGFIAQNGGKANLDANVLAQGLPTRYGRAFARSVLVRQTLLKRYGVATDPGQPPVDPQRRQQALQRLFGGYVRAGHRLKVHINPRYGTFDFQRMALGPVCPALSSPDSGTPSGTGEVKCQV